MLTHFWKLLRVEKNRQILSWIGGGVPVVAAGAGAVFVYIVPHEKKPEEPPKASGSTTITFNNPVGQTAGGNIINQRPVIIGLDEKKIAEKMAEERKFAKEQYDRLAAQIAREKGVEFAPLRAILSKLGEAGVSDDNIAARLSQKADELIALRVENSRLRQGPSEMASFAERAQALIDKGEFDAARAVLAEGREAARKLRERSSLFEADYLAQEAKVDHLQLSYRSAAAKYAEAAALVQSFDKRKQREFLQKQAIELYAQGDEFADNASLTEGIALYKSLLGSISRPDLPSDWAATQNNLGTALWTLGGRESGTVRLEEAVAAYRAALEERTRARVPLQWAATHNNLGNALQTLGGRESGTARLEEAVAAYRAALEERTRARVPLQWAATQNNL